MGYVAAFVLASAATAFAAPWLVRQGGAPALQWLCCALIVAAATAFPLALHSRRFGRAFVASSVAIAGQIGLCAAALFPRLVPSRPDLAQSLTVYNASSSPRTLTTMLVIALVGMPLVIAYTVAIYRVFRGKTVLTATSY